MSTIISAGAFAHKKQAGPAVHPANFVNGSSFSTDRTLSKTTATGDTVIMSNISATDTPTLYYAGMTRDSGFVSGTDAWGDMGFAERYDFGTADSSLKVIGVMAIFGGKYNPASTKNVTFYTWSAGAQSVNPTYSAPYYDSGLPDVALDSVHVPITHLGIRSVDTVGDTLKAHFFTTPTAYLNQSFFVGYTINYDPAAMGGDTIGVYTTKDGDRTSPLYTTSGTDTIFNNQNVAMFDDGQWYDNGVDNFFLANDYLMFPIVIVHENLAVSGVSNKNLTFFGNYPNPASESTNIRFSLAKASDVAIAILDIKGSVVKTLNANKLGAGEHTVNVNVAGLAAGDYTYVIRSSNGGGIASKLTVIK